MRFIKFKERVNKEDKGQQVEVARYRGDRFIYKNEKLQKASL